MPPKEDGDSSKSFTWITGNPRSKKNITQIRRHAGQNSGLKSESGGRVQSGSSPKGSPSSATHPFRAVNSSRENHDKNHPPSSSYGEQAFSVDGSYSSIPIERPGATLRPIYTEFDTARPPYLTTPDVLLQTNGDTAPTRKLAIWDLVNHSAEEEEQHRRDVLASTPGQVTDDDQSDYFSRRTSDSETSAYALSEARSCSPRPARKSLLPSASSTVASSANISKRRKATGPTTASPQGPWRLGRTTPSRSLALSKEDSQIDQILHRTSAFYTGQFESSWSAQLRKNGFDYFDKIPDVETFATSITTAGALLALGRLDSASSILSHAMPKLPHLLSLQNPQLYFLLADLSLSAGSGSALCRLRAQVKQSAAVTAYETLGATHPITDVLQLQAVDMSASQRLHLRELIQRRIHELHVTLFGANAYQTTAQHYYLSRVLGQLGRHDQACDVLSQVVADWEGIYGINNIMPITGLLELAKFHLNLNNASQQTEAMLSDVLHRTLTLTLEQESSSSSIAESDSESPPPGPNAKFANLVHARIGCLRTIGRLQIIRDNLDAAMFQYTAAARVGIEELGVHVPAVQLAIADLEAVRRMVAARARGDDSVRLEWLAQTPVEVGVRWLDPHQGGRVEPTARQLEKETVLKELGLMRDTSEGIEAIAYGRYAR